VVPDEAMQQAAGQPGQGQPGDDHHGRGGGMYL
jgi:hypothetical protein